MFQQYFVNTIKNHYVDFTGRARRSEYWYFQLFGFLIQLAIYALIFLLGAMSSTLVMIVSGISMILSLALVLPNLSLCVRRLHDTGKSGWFLLLAFIPLIGAIVLLVFFCMEGDAQDNKYGPNPKAMEHGSMETV